VISEGDDRPPNAVKDALSAYGYRCVLYASAAAGDYRMFIGLSPAYVRGRARMREMKYARTEYATKVSGSVFLAGYYSGAYKCLRGALFIE